MTDRDCMYQMPEELTGLCCMCAMLKSPCNMSKDCIGFKKHTKESRQYLNEAIEKKNERRQQMTNGEKYKTAQERAEAFRSFCQPHACHNCKECKVYNDGKGSDIDCAFQWLDLECEEEKPLPCPFCGGETIIRANWNSTHQVVCNSQGCWYCSKCETTASDAISAHNRVAKNVRKGKE